MLGRHIITVYTLLLINMLRCENNKKQRFNGDVFEATFRARIGIAQIIYVIIINLNAFIVLISLFMFK